MKPADFAKLLVLAALWGGSYLFIRMGAGEFGPVALAGVRAAGAAVLLLPFLFRGNAGRDLRVHWRSLVLVGVAQSALPYVLFSYAALTITAGMSSIFTATTPLFAAAIAWWWLGERPTVARAAGLGIGFAGVLWLAWDKAGVKTSSGSVGLALAACLAAALLYALAAHFAKRRLATVPPLTVAAGSQLVSAVLLAGPAVALWPAQAPSLRAWGAVAGLAVACTAVAYVLFFRLIASVGPARTVTVTFLIPAFGLLWGGLFLGERVSPHLLLGCAVILLGTALTTGVLKLRRPGRGSDALAHAMVSR